ncbi:hypothetical protein L6164_029034 [Bauhinia variegata]|uniref:Uncharacterized protein n=2 Tax=Bauhinia variegata TaxID=167791 RepID=A0ACB9L8G8_BAUVA|nr:hypothetical protein L6164_029033 [Bauhinia variegata]KAI4305683.1 hypothetical protein L6164_029034 [Bauhinia variegata]
MDMKLSVIQFTLILLLASFANYAQCLVIDIKKYGAPNGDITSGLTKAWKEACTSRTKAKIYIPKGTYNLLQIEFRGPCNAPIDFHVDGMIKAPAEYTKMDGNKQWIRFDHISHLTLLGSGVFDGQGAAAWKQNDCGINKNCRKLPMNFGFGFLNHSIIRDITSKDSKTFHVNVLSCNNVSFIHFTVTAPETSLNTDGIHIGRSTDIKILNSNIATGDDCISVGDGNKQVMIEKVTCGPGHGISVGSLGMYAYEQNVEGLFVKSCTIKNTQNGVRIKTWPSSVGAIHASDMHFEDITMINVSNPVIIDQEYCPWNRCSKQIPSKIKISKVVFKDIRGTSATKEGVTLLCSRSVPCEEVLLSNIDLKFKGTPAIAKCINVKPILQGNVPACTR